MKRALLALIAGTVLSGMAAAYATATHRPLSPAESAAIEAAAVALN